MASYVLDIVVNARDQASGALGKVTSGLGGIVKMAAGFAGGQLILGGLGKLKDGLSSIVEEAGAAQQAQAALGAVLQSTGGQAGVTADMANGLADSLSKVTTFEDDAILGGENLLLTFTNIGKDVFPNATETMLNMSQAMGQDLKSSAVQLGKALQDPAEGVSALTRVGVNFTEAQKAQIQAMVEAGNAAGAQRLILAELNREFGGAAEAAGKTVPGQMKILMNQLGNIKEQIGTALLPVLERLIQTFGPILIDVGTKAVTWVNDKLVPILMDVVTVFEVVFRELRAGNTDVRDIFNKVWASISLELNFKIFAIQHAVELFILHVRAKWEYGWTHFKEFFTDTWARMLAWFEDKKNRIETWIERQKQYLSSHTWKTIGENLIKGIVDGITTGANWLWEKIKWLASEAIRLAKSVLGIHSPSSVFAEIGSQVAAGFGQGIDAQRAQPIRAVTRMAAGAVAGGLGVTNAVTNHYNLTYNSRQTEGELSVGQTLRMMQMLAGA